MQQDRPGIQQTSLPEPVFDDLPEATESELASWEEELLGYSGRAFFTDFDYAGQNCIRLVDYSVLGNKDTAECPVRVIKVTNKKDKNGKPMAFLTVKDDENTAEITVFENALPKNGNGTINRKFFKEGESILVNCRINAWKVAKAESGVIRLQALSMRPLAAYSSEIIQ